MFGGALIAEPLLAWPWHAADHRRPHAAKLLRDQHPVRLSTVEDMKCHGHCLYCDPRETRWRAKPVGCGCTATVPACGTPPRTASCITNQNNMVHVAGHAASRPCWEWQRFYSNKSRLSALDTSQISACTTRATSLIVKGAGLAWQSEVAYRSRRFSGVTPKPR
jgi:hypothetical protein